MKKRLEILSLHTGALKIMIICYIVPDIWHVTHVTFIFHSGLFFSLLSHNNQKNQIFKKMKRVSEDIIILHIYTKKL